MKVFDGIYSYVFSYKKNDITAHGNPALTVFGDMSIAEELLIARKSRVMLNNSLIQLPIVSFIKPIDIDNYKFSIKYRFCDGSSVNVCGHGTIAATLSIIQNYRMNIKDSIKKIFEFQLEKTFEENRKFSSLYVTCLDENKFKISFNDTSFTKNFNPKITEIIDSISDNIDIETLYRTNLDDYICVLNNSDILRNLRVNRTILLKIRELDCNFRQLNIVSVSKDPNFDYETMVFLILCHLLGLWMQLVVQQISVYQNY